MSVQKKVIVSTPKTIYVKPNRKYGEEMETAQKWLVGHGMNEDSLYLTLFENPFAKDLFVFRDENHHGFCIVATKDCWDAVGQPVLAYSTNNSLFLAEWSGYKEILNSYRDQITALKRGPAIITGKHEKHYGQNNDQVKPMLGRLMWGQGFPYNQYVAFSVNGKQGVIGCVPLAVAMIINYHKWPKQAQSHVYYQTEQKTYKMDMDGFTPEWDTYRDSYSKEDTVQCKNLALLLSKLGISVDASYKGNETSADMVHVKSTLCNNFMYSGKMNLNLMPLSDERMLRIIFKELDEGRPLIVSIPNHTFVCDGYDGDFLHYNLGWHGTANGYYRLKLGEYESGNSLLVIKSIIYGIEPQYEDVTRNVTQTTAGTLGQQLSDHEKGIITHLTISGPLNSADIKLLRKMAGATYEGTADEAWKGGALRTLDLSNATIVSDKTPYLTEKASGTWYHSETSMYGSRSSIYNFDTMDESKWKKFKNEIGTKQEGIFYTRTDDNKYWANYFCTKNVIGQHMFEQCTSLYKIILPEKITKIDSYAFLDCWSLSKIHIPERVKETGEKPFFRCLSLESVEAPRKMVSNKVLCEECSPALQKVTRY